MTRINVVPVAELSDLHLIAEYRELPRLFTLIRSAVARGEDPSSFPPTYRLGPGHVRFFYNKINWLVARFDKLVAEMRYRGFNVSFPRAPVYGLPFTNVWNQPYTSTDADLRLNRERIAIRTEEWLVKQKMKGR